MSLLTDVQHCFAAIGNSLDVDEETKEVTSTFDPDAVPGISGMRDYNENRILSSIRRAYRYYAGMKMPNEHDEMYELTKQRLSSLIAAVVIEAFCDGIQIGKKEFDSGTLNDLFSNDDFRAESLGMSLEIASEPGVGVFFGEYVLGASEALAHGTGFAHGTGSAHKIWDLWIMASTSMVSSAYIAGHQLGGIWADRETTVEMDTKLEEDE